MDDRDRSDAIVVTYSPTTRADRRLVFEPVSSDGYNRVELVRTPERGWRQVGGERVDAVDVEMPE